MDTLFSATAAKLKSFPMMGKPGQNPGTRELIPHESYRLVYQIEADVLWGLALVHTARMWPPLIDD
jgi:plasmid stabilization system protein ParE